MCEVGSADRARSPSDRSQCEAIKRRDKRSRSGRSRRNGRHCIQPPALSVSQVPTLHRPCKQRAGRHARIELHLHIAVEAAGRRRETSGRTRPARTHPLGLNAGARQWVQGTGQPDVHDDGIRAERCVTDGETSSSTCTALNPRAPSPSRTPSIQLRQLHILKLSFSRYAVFGAYSFGSQVLQYTYLTRSSSSITSNGQAKASADDGAVPQWQ